MAGEAYLCHANRKYRNKESEKVAEGATDPCEAALECTIIHNFMNTSEDC